MPSPPFSSPSPKLDLRAVVRALRHGILQASREGRCSEIVAWSNAVASMSIGAFAYMLSGAWGIGLAVAVAALVVLRLAIAHPRAVWIAASLGTVAVAAAG